MKISHHLIRNNPTLSPHPSKTIDYPTPPPKSWTNNFSLQNLRMMRNYSIIVKYTNFSSKQAL